MYKLDFTFLFKQNIVFISLKRKCHITLIERLCVWPSLVLTHFWKYSTLSQCISWCDLVCHNIVLTSLKRKCHISSMCTYRKFMCLTIFSSYTSLEVFLIESMHEIDWCDLVCLGGIYFVCKFGCVSSGGTLGLHGRNPCEGAAVSARADTCLSINTKQLARNSSSL